MEDQKFETVKFSEVLNDVLDGFYSTLMKKNESYGSSVFRAPILCPALPPRVGILTRASDKMNRLFSGGRIEGETFDDTLFDLAGYIVLYFVAKNMNGGKSDDGKEEEGGET